VTDSPMDLTHGLLVQIATFLRGLSAEQVADLTAGESRLALVPKGARITTTSATGRHRAPAEVNSAQISEDLRKIGERGAATTYLTDLKLTNGQLKQLCADLNVPMKSSARKDDFIHGIVGLLVGRRIDADAIFRGSSAR
jgi:hypothetical protein